MVNDFTPDLHEVLELLDFIAFHADPTKPKSPEDIIKLLDAAKARVVFKAKSAQIAKNKPLRP